MNMMNEICLFGIRKSQKKLSKIYIKKNCQKRKNPDFTIAELSLKATNQKFVLKKSAIFISRSRF